MQRDKEAVAALMREKQKKGTFPIPSHPISPAPTPRPFNAFKALHMLIASSTRVAEEKKAAEAAKK